MTVNKTLSQLAVLAIGTMFGSFMCFFVWEYRLYHVLQATERRHNATNEELWNRWNNDHQKLEACLDDEKRLQEMATLQGQLTVAQDLEQKLVEKYRSLEQQAIDLDWERHDAVQESERLDRELQRQIEERNDLERAAEEWEQTKNELEEQQHKLQTLVTEKEEAIVELERQKEEQVATNAKEREKYEKEKEEIMKEKQNEVAALKNKHAETLATQQQEMDAMKNSIQPSLKEYVMRREDFLCRRT